MFSLVSNILTIVIVFAYYSYKTFIFIYKATAVVAAFIDRLVEAMMIRTVYRLSDTQRKVLMHTFILVGVGLVRELGS